MASVSELQLTQYAPDICVLRDVGQELSSTYQLNLLHLLGPGPDRQVDASRWLW